MRAAGQTSDEAAIGTRMDINTILIILNTVLLSISTTILGMRCKFKKTRDGIVASLRPANSDPSPKTTPDAPAAAAAAPPIVVQQPSLERARPLSKSCSQLGRTASAELLPLPKPVVDAPKSGSEANIEYLVAS